MNTVLRLLNGAAGAIRDYRSMARRNRRSANEQRIKRAINQTIMPHQPDKSVPFAQQSFEDQLTVLWQRGKVLETRRLPGFWLHLYSLDTLFIELWICQRRYEVSMLRLMDSTDELEPYLHKITLDKLTA